MAGEGGSSVCSRVLEETPPHAAEGRQHMGSGSAPGAGEGVASYGGITADGLNLVTRGTSSGADNLLPL